MRPRVVVANRADGGIRVLARQAVRLRGARRCSRRSGSSCVVDLQLLLDRTRRRCPTSRATRTSRPGVSRIYAADGTLLGEFAKEWRELVPYERIPQAARRRVPRRRGSRLLRPRRHLLQGHRARGVANITAGDFAQGGSTITQQVAKQFLGSEKSLSRKGKEAIMARRLEATLLEARDPRGLPEPHLPRRRRVGRRGRGAALLPEGARPAHARRGGADRRAREGADARSRRCAQPKLATERRNVVLDKMAAYGFAQRRRGRRREGRADQARPLPRRVPRSHAVLRRARAPLHRASRYGADALLRASGLRDRDRRRADVGGRRVRERRLRRAPPGQAPGLARPRVAPRRRRARACSSRARSSSTATAPLAPGKRYLALVDKVDGERRRGPDRRPPARRCRCAT